MPCTDTSGALPLSSPPSPPSLTPKRSSFFASYRDARSLRSSQNNSKARRHSILGSSSLTSNKNKVFHRTNASETASPGASQNSTNTKKNIVSAASSNRNSAVLDSKDSTALFGLPLQSANALSSANAVIRYLDSYLISLNIPSVINTAISFLVENNCFEKEGVFRVGGSLKRIKKLQEIFNTAPGSDLHDYSKFDKETQDIIKQLTVYDVATLLKRYLNALPDSIIPPEAFKSIKQELESVNYRDFLIFSQSASEAQSLKIGLECINAEAVDKAEEQYGQDAQSGELDSSENSEQFEDAVPDANRLGDKGHSTTEQDDKSTAADISDMQSDDFDVDNVGNKNKSVLVIDVNPDQPLSVIRSRQQTASEEPKPEILNSGTSKADNNGAQGPALSVEFAGPLEKRKAAGDSLLKAINSNRPRPPMNYRKHSLMSLLSIDSGLDSKSFNSSGNYNLPHVKHSTDSLHNNLHNTLYQKSNLGSETEQKLPSQIKDTINKFLDFLVHYLYDELNIVNLDVFIYILNFLSKLSDLDNFEKTKMNSFNLSKIFQTSFFLNNHFNSTQNIVALGAASNVNIDILNGVSNNFPNSNSLNKINSNTTASTSANNNNNRLSVSINANTTYNGNNNNNNNNSNNNRLAPTVTRGSIISTNSGFSGLSSKLYGNADNNTMSSLNFNNNNLGVPSKNFSLESFNSINVDYNINQLVLKVLIDNFDLFVFKLFQLDLEHENDRKIFKSEKEIEFEKEQSSKNTLQSQPGIENTEPQDKETKRVVPERISTDGNSNKSKVFGSNTTSPIISNAHTLKSSVDNNTGLAKLSNSVDLSKEAGSKESAEPPAVTVSQPPAEQNSQAKDHSAPTGLKRHKLQSIFSFLHKNKNKDKKSKNDSSVDVADKDVAPLTTGVESSVAVPQGPASVVDGKPDGHPQESATQTNQSPVCALPKIIEPAAEQSSNGEPIAIDKTDLNTFISQEDNMNSITISNPPPSTPAPIAPSMVETVPSTKPQATSTPSQTQEPENQHVSDLKQKIQGSNKVNNGGEIIEQQATASPIIEQDVSDVNGATIGKNPAVETPSQVNEDAEPPVDRASEKSATVDNSIVDTSSADVTAPPTIQKITRRQSALSLLLSKHKKGNGSFIDTSSINNSATTNLPKTPKTPKTQKTAAGQISLAGRESTASSRNDSKASLSKLSSEDLPKRRFSTFFKRRNSGIVN